MRLGTAARRVKEPRRAAEREPDRAYYGEGRAAVRAGPSGRYLPVEGRARPRAEPAAHVQRRGQAVKASEIGRASAPPSELARPSPDVPSTNHRERASLLPISRQRGSLPPPAFTAPLKSSCRPQGPLLRPVPSLDAAGAPSSPPPHHPARTLAAPSTQDPAAHPAPHSARPVHLPGLGAGSALARRLDICPG